jgi:hypothetical protein
MELARGYIWHIRILEAVPFNLDLRTRHAAVTRDPLNIFINARMKKYTAYTDSEAGNQKRPAPTATTLMFGVTRNTFKAIVT